MLRKSFSETELRISSDNVNNAKIKILSPTKEENKKLKLHEEEESSESDGIHKDLGVEKIQRRKRAISSCVQK